MPTLPKVIVFILLVISTIFLPRTSLVCPNGPVGVSCQPVSVSGIGYPTFYGGEFSGDAGEMTFNTIYFLINIVIFYTVSSLIVLPFRKDIR